MKLELGRPYIDVTLTGPAAHAVTAHAYIDTGGGALLFSVGLAKQLGLKETGTPEHEEGETLAPTVAPALSIGGKRIDVGDTHAFIVADAQDTLAHTDAQMMLPGRALRHDVVVFDYQHMRSRSPIRAISSRMEHRCMRLSAAACRWCAPPLQARPTTSCWIRAASTA